MVTALGLYALAGVRVFIDFHHAGAAGDAARHEANASPLALSAGCTSTDERVVVMRVLADRVEPAMALLTQVWASWRQEAWALAPCPPRVWRT